MDKVRKIEPTELPNHTMVYFESKSTNNYYSYVCSCGANHNTPNLREE